MSVYFSYFFLNFFSSKSSWFSKSQLGNYLSHSELFVTPEHTLRQDCTAWQLRDTFSYELSSASSPTNGHVCRDVHTRFNWFIYMFNSIRALLYSTFLPLQHRFSKSFLETLNYPYCANRLSCQVGTPKLEKVTKKGWISSARINLNLNLSPRDVTGYFRARYATTLTLRLNLFAREKRRRTSCEIDTPLFLTSGKNLWKMSCSKCGKCAKIRLYNRVANPIKPHWKWDLTVWGEFTYQEESF